MRDHDQTGDRTLWCAVIAQAIEDAARRLPSPDSSIYRERLKLRAEARRYFSAMTPDLRHVCHLAGLDPDAVYASALERIAEADRTASTAIASPGQPRRNRPLIHHDGVSLSLSEWAKLLGLKVGTLSARMRKGWPLSEALTGTTYSGARPQPAPQASSIAT